MSATLVGTVRGLFAICNVTAQVGPLFAVNRGFVNPPVRNAAGDYTLTLQEGVTFNEASVMAQSFGAVALIVGVEYVTSTTLRVRIADALGVLTDANFSVWVQDVGPS